MIWEPRPYNRDLNKIWFSQKSHGAGVRYELGICIKTGDICWYNGPFPCGWGPDIKIFNQKLKGMLLPFEKIMADRNYKNSTRAYTKCHVTKYLDEVRRIKTPEYDAMAKALARHENINGWFKEFGCLSQVYRNDRSKHHILFTAIAAIIQIEMHNGRSAFEANDYIDRITDNVL